MDKKSHVLTFPVSYTTMESTYPKLIPFANE
jgi:hypothetical protein